MLFHPIWKSKLDKMVVLQPVTFRTKKEFNLHKILRAIDSNVILSKLIETDYCRTSETMVPLKNYRKFSDHPKLLKIPNVSSPNVILNSNLKHPKTKHTIQTVEKMICNY
jgi:DNA polymerase-3 subunit alpha/error-prone DNA polymerase